MKLADPRWQAAFDKASALAEQDAARSLLIWKNRAQATGSWAKTILGAVGVVAVLALIRGR